MFSFSVVFKLCLFLSLGHFLNREIVLELSQVFIPFEN
jgi:hypothetical protein